MPRPVFSIIFLCLLLSTGWFSGCGSTIAVGVSSDGASPVASETPQTLTDYDLDPPGSPGASAPAW